VTDEERIYIRNHISDKEPPTDDDLEERMAVLQDTTLVIGEILTKRRAQLLAAGPLDFTVVGEYSEDRSKNLDALERQMKALGIPLGTGGNVARTAKLVRRPVIGR
jgi:hypothetical protein